MRTASWRPLASDTPIAGQPILEPLPDRLRDEGLPGLRATAMRARAAYGPKDSVRDALPPDVTEPFLDSIDRLLREINRAMARGS